MYSLNHIKNPSENLDCIEISNNQNRSYAKIHLNHGASLQELKLEGNILIQDLNPLEYSNTYASSILFPFANRIKDGAYNFENQHYQFDINEKDRNNALHGLVYNKTFKVISQETSENIASIKLVYNEENKSIGFPFTYSIQLEYVLTKHTLDINVTITNTDTKSFPFTLGWHPYFLSDNLYDSNLQFKSSEKTVFDDRMITTHLDENPNAEEFKIEDNQLDDCWVLDTKDVSFNTPKYKLTINSSEENSFLQVYTPPKANTIAIEPTTGISDSFNNKIGLQVLNPNETYNLNWNLKLS